MRCSGCRWIALSLALLAGVALADSGSSGGTTTYRWVDAQGVVHYSDTPQPGAQRLQIQPAQTFRDPGVAAARATPPPQSAAVYQTCTITAPQAEKSFYAPEAVVVSVELAPTLRPGDQVTVMMDGQPLAPGDDNELSFRVASPDRGTHSVQALVRGADGQTLCTATAVTFYVERPSLLSPTSPAARQGGSSPPVPVH